MRPPFGARSRRPSRDGDLAIVLRRDGLMRRPFYHVVVERNGGEIVEKLGVYNPMLPTVHPDRLILRGQRLDHWRSQGVRISADVLKVIGP